MSDSEVTGHSTISERLLARLRDELHLTLPENVRLERTYHGYWQRKQGAWSWRVHSADGSLPVVDGRAIVIGSLHTMTELVNANRLVVDETAGDISISPAEHHD